MTEPRRFPLLEITGGPHGKNIKASVDGVPLRATQRIELVVDVNDVVRAKIYEIVEARVSMETIDASDGSVFLEVRKPEIVDITGNVREVHYVDVVKAKGRTLVDALRRAAELIEQVEAP